MISLQPMTRAYVQTLGEAGRRWHEGLPDVLGELAERWGLTYGRSVPGGSGSYVVAAQQRDREVVVKVAVEADVQGPLETMAAADGRGYCRVFASAPEHHALLLERLGASLWQQTLPPEEKLDVLATTLEQAWMPAGDRPAFDKAGELAGIVEDLGAALSRRLYDAALAEARALGTVEDVRWLHGDPHPANCLRRGSDWVFVDPDGFVADPAYDLGVTLRDWSDVVDAAGLQRWSRRLEDLTGIDAGRIWSWAFVERVTTGLWVLDRGSPAVARPFLDSAEALVRAGSPAPRP